jgi:hypothetical protein
VDCFGPAWMACPTPKAFPPTCFRSYNSVIHAFGFSPAPPDRRLLAPASKIPAERVSNAVASAF